MREITLPEHLKQAFVSQALMGRWFAVPVKVGWPELQLTEEQILSNAAADACGVERPFPDQSLILVKIPTSWAMPG